MHFISASVVTKVEFPEMERQKNTQQIEDKRNAFPQLAPQKLCILEKTGPKRPEKTFLRTFFAHTRTRAGIGRKR